MNTQQTIRNFSIIAHIDHGKTTLTDQLLIKTGAVDSKKMIDRLLDSNPIERERGVTIKLAPVTMSYTLKAKRYTLNLIDTPGHVDFSYEVSRSLSACEGAVLLIDASQGVQAQTLAHAERAMNLGLTVIPVINKIDLPSAQIEETTQQLHDIFGFKADEIIKVSAKTGEGVENLIASIISNIPEPIGVIDAVPRVLIFNSIYHQHLGVIAFVRVVDGMIKKGTEAILLQGKTTCELKEIGIFTPERKSLPELSAGEVGYIATGVKNIRNIKVGDTLTKEDSKFSVNPLPGFKVPKPVVFADIFPSSGEDFSKLKYAVEQLQLMDAALTTNQIHSPALGSGFRLGFLGLFHTEITQERLKRELDVDTIITKPTVEYEVLTHQQSIKIRHASELPDPSLIRVMKEPIVNIKIVTPREFLGSVMQLIQERRGEYQDTIYYGNQAQLLYQLPLVELISGFVDELKSVSQGYASLDYTHTDLKPVDAVKLSILINHEEIDSLSRIVVRSNCESIGREIVKKLKELLPRQLYAVPIQAAVGGKVVARETKPAARKDVTAKLYGGDRTRRMKLLEKQKKGKKKLALQGQIIVPDHVYTNLLKV